MNIDGIIAQSPKLKMLVQSAIQEIAIGCCGLSISTYHFDVNVSDDG
jgi:hypothetical protein